MSEDRTEQQTKPSTDIVGRRVDFGIPGEGEGLSWGIEIDIDISDSLVRSRFQESSFKLPKHVQKIKYLELAPQEALPPEQRTIRSKMKPRSVFGESGLVSVATPARPGNPILEKIRYEFNVLGPEDQKRFKALGAMVSWVFGPSSKDKERFNSVLEKSKGDTLVIVHGHSGDLSGMGEQYPDAVVDESGNVIQREHNFVPIDEILSRYNNPGKFAAIVLHGCNTHRGSVEAKSVPVFYPTTGVKHTGNPGIIWSPPGGFSLPKED